jgi:hypothetical protein
MKFFYTLHTDAPYDVARNVAIDIAMKHGHAAYLSEAEVDESAAVAAAAAKRIEDFVDAQKDASRNFHKVLFIEPQQRVWTATRWGFVLLALTASPFVFRYLPHATALQGYGIGWIAAAVVLLAGRGGRG